MSHTWHKVPYAAKRRSRIPMHPASVWMMGPSCIYGRTSRRQGEESRRERWKSNYFFFFFFFFFPLSRCLPSCVRQIRAGGGKKKLRRTVLRRATSWEVSEYESQTFALARCQRHSIHLSILDLSLSGGAILVLFCERAPSSTYRMRFVPIKKNLRSTESPL